VASLRLELDAEKRAHARLRERAEHDILSLHAQLARRDTELEACTLHVEHNLAASSSELRSTLSGQRKPRRPKLQSPTETFTREEAIRVLELTAARNRALEVEVKELIETVSSSVSA